ncbi:phage tail protein [Kaistia defluvii]|uniref:phage tail protein n=1 Tax=Kaistia defluvii TaxID=410841 RepID=UPI00224FD619|nr:phage tail protein [Kaistia defluvii]MCX5518441.1 phage tail protein [Kaistia defluvii]
MRFIMLIITALVFFAGAIEPAQALPIGAAIAGFIGLTGTLATVVAAGINLAVGLGLSYLSQTLFGKKPQQGVGGMSGKLQSGGAVPRSFILGRAMTGGKLVYAGTWGEIDNTPNAYLSMVIALSDLPVQGLAEIWVGGEKVTWDPNATPGGIGIAIPEYRNDNKNHLMVRFYDGRQTTADSLMVEKFAGSAHPYLSTRVGKGVAYVVMTARLNDKLWSGLPQYKFVVDGIPLYDWRADSSAGGDGPQRWSDPTTWTFSDNPVVQAYNIGRGLRYDGKWFFGGQTVSAAQWPISVATAAANECDRMVAAIGSGTEKQFRAAGEITLDAFPSDVLSELMKACNGRLAEVGGVYKPHVGAAGSAVFAFTDADILTSDKQSLEPFPSLDQAVNAVTAKYLEPGEGWVQKDAPPLYSLTLEADDGGRRQAVDVDYALVFSGTQVQRLMKSARDESRRFRRHNLPMPSYCSIFEPNDFVSWSSDRNRYANKLWRIDAVQDLPSLNSGWTLTEVDPSDYNPGALTPIVIAPTLNLPPASQIIIDWSATPVAINGDQGSQRAGVRLAWDPNVDDVDGVQFEIRLAVDGTVILQSETDRYDAGSILISQNILGRTQYQARGRYRPSSPRDTSWSGWLNVLTPDVAEGMTQQQAYELSLMTGDARGSMQELQRQLDEVIDRIALDGAESVGAGYIQRAAIRGDLQASIQQVTQAFATADSAVASQVTAINVKADQMSAGGFVKFAATAAPSGVDVRFQIFLNAGTVGTPNWKEAGMLLDIVGGVSRCTFLVDQFSIGDGTTRVVPFAIVGGVVYMTGVVIRSTNSVLQLDLSGENLIFSEP